MDENGAFAEDKTIKVSGISEFLKDNLTKHLQQQRDNIAGIIGDVERVFVCPDGKDYVLVEFSELKDGINSKREIDADGSTLKIEPYSRQATSAVHEWVSKIWKDEEEIIIPPKSCDGSSSNGNYSECSQTRKDNRTRKQNSTKEKRQDQFHDNRKSTAKSEPAMAGGLSEETPLFEQTKVKLNDGILKKIVPSSPNNFKAREMLRKEKVEIDEMGYLSGSWNAIYNVFKQFTNSVFGETPSSPVDELTENGTSGDCAGQEIMTVQSLLMRYIMKYHYEVFEALDNVSSQIQFKTISASEKCLKLVPCEGVKEEFTKAMDEFIDLYQKFYQDMHQENIQVNQLPSANFSLNEVILAVRAKVQSVIVCLARDGKQITVYGTKEKTKEAVSFVKEKLNASDIFNNTPNVNKEFSMKKLSCTISGKVKLFVYQGDITEEKVDAIVNPANEDLKHGGGAALMILERGGRDIQSESDEIISKRHGRRLQAGHVEITTAGNLPCNFVIHAVGPRWSSHSSERSRSLLNQAVTNSLWIASQNKAQLIAIPAISSGLFGMPVKTCAEVLFNAVEQFVVGGNDSCSLTEIRFVNNDAPTVKVFEQEMMKRYKSAVTTVQGGLANDAKMNVGMTNNHLENIPPDDKSQQNVGQNNKHGGFYEAKSANEPKRPSSYSNAVSKGSKATSADKTPKADSSAECPICLEVIKNPKTLSKCNHSFCTECIDNAFEYQKKCPLCSEVYGVLTGNQPPGKMWFNTAYYSLPGYKKCGTINIFYDFPSGLQASNHPNPGKRYFGTSRTGYLPDNETGRKVLKLLKKAFDQKLTFTIGRSSTTGAENVVTWNDIHHKTDKYGGPTRYGYPDPDYLTRVQDELAAKGIKE